MSALLRRFASAAALPRVAVPSVVPSLGLALRVAPAIRVKPTVTVPRFSGYGVRWAHGGLTMGVPGVSPGPPEVVGPAAANHPPTHRPGEPNPNDPGPPMLPPTAEELKMYEAKMKHMSQFPCEDPHGGAPDPDGAEWYWDPDKIEERDHLIKYVAILREKLKNDTAEYDDFINAGFDVNPMQWEPRGTAYERWKAEGRVFMDELGKYRVKFGDKLLYVAFPGAQSLELAMPTPWDWHTFETPVIVKAPERGSNAGH